MQRRDFLSKLAGGAAVAAVPVVVSSSAHQMASTGRESLEKLKLEMQAKVAQLEKDYEKLNQRHKRTLKIIGVVAGASLGIDLVSVI